MSLSSCLLQEGDNPMPKIAEKQYTVTIPSYNSRDVEFLDEIRSAHDNDKLSDVGSDIEKAFKRRIEDEFLGKPITQKTRASITEFCWYLLSISKLFGYSLLTGGFVATIHKEVFSIRNRPTTGNDALSDATFTYFDSQGIYRLTANGYMRWDWQIAPDDPSARRTQIIRDNNGTLPGYASEKELCEDCHIYIEIVGQFPLLVLPV